MCYTKFYIRIGYMHVSCDFTTKKKKKKGKREKKVTNKHGTQRVQTIAWAVYIHRVTWTLDVLTLINASIAWDFSLVTQCVRATTCGWKFRLRTVRTKMKFCTAQMTRNYRYNELFSSILHNTTLCICILHYIHTILGILMLFCSAWWVTFAILHVDYWVIGKIITWKNQRGQRSCFDVLTFF